MDDKSPQPSQPAKASSHACGYRNDGIYCATCDIEQVEQSAVVLDDERAAFEDWWYAKINSSESPLDIAYGIWRELVAARAASPQSTVCATCNGHGMIGGPSYYAPDEGGEPCPDCAASTQPARARALTDDQIMYIVRYSTAGSNAIPREEWCAFARALLAHVFASGGDHD